MKFIYNLISVIISLVKNSFPLIGDLKNLYCPYIFYFHSVSSKLKFNASLLDEFRCDAIKFTLFKKFASHYLQIKHTYAIIQLKLSASALISYLLWMLFFSQSSRFWKLFNPLTHNWFSHVFFLSCSFTFEIPFQGFPLLTQVFHFPFWFSRDLDGGGLQHPAPRTTLPPWGQEPEALGPFFFDSRGLFALNI